MVDSVSSMSAMDLNPSRVGDGRAPETAETPGQECSSNKTIQNWSSSPLETESRFVMDNPAHSGQDGIGEEGDASSNPAPATVVPSPRMSAPKHECDDIGEALTEKNHQNSGEALSEINQQKDMQYETSNRAWHSVVSPFPGDQEAVLSGIGPTNRTGEQAASVIKVVQFDQQTVQLSENGDARVVSPPAIFSDNESATVVAVKEEANIKSSMESTISAATEWKDQGNISFTKKEYLAALEAYQRALGILQPHLTSYNGDGRDPAASTATLLDRDVVWLCQTLHGNCAMVWVRLQEYSRAEQSCEEAIRVVLSFNRHQPNGINRYNMDVQQQPSKQRHEEPRMMVPAKIWYRRALAREGQAHACLGRVTRTNTPRRRPRSDPNDDDLYQAARGTHNNNQMEQQQDHGSENLRQDSQVNPAQARLLLDQALKDLHVALEALEKYEIDPHRIKPLPASSSSPLSEKDGMQRAVMSAEARINKTIHELAGQGQGPVPHLVDSPLASELPSHLGSTNGQKKLQLSPGPDSVAPSRQQQRQDVVRLLLGRKASLTLANNNNNHPSSIQTHSNNNQQHHNEGSAGSSQAALSGEALFLLDWTWWCKWCQYVELFETRSQGKTKQGANQQTLWILQCLPPGAVVPGYGGDDNRSKDEDKLDVGSPGPINNSRLLQEVPTKFTQNTGTQSVFYRHWYSPYVETIGQRSVSQTTGGKRQQVDLLLRPHIVRGYHYELIPREVYVALRTWYGEVTPSLCRRTLVNEDSRITFPLYPGTPHDDPQLSSGNFCHACLAPRAISRCTRCFSAYYCDRTCQETHWFIHKLDCKTAQEQPMTLPCPNGLVGLNNLGNTCFMNSALQCLSHATPMTRFFLSGRFRLDLNPSNPLGTGGKLANAYEVVMKDIWMQSGSSTSPTSLKRAIALFAPRFAGCLQHDAQEFLAYLLDGLHEDLNRIRKAPYVEMPDVSNGQHLAASAARVWDAHRRRNDSLVMDTFYGQFKSTCVCPQCQSVSVSFDAFNHVSLEIPQEKFALFPLSILVFFSPTTERPVFKPVRFGVQLRRSQCVGDLRSTLSKLSGIPFERLKICEVDDNIILDLLNDKRSLSEIRPGDLIVAYEVDEFDKMTFHAVAAHKLVDRREASDEMKSTENGSDLFGFPFMTSFSAELKIKDVWEHIWSLVFHLVASGDSSRVDDKNLLEIHVQDNHGKPILAFPLKGADDVTQLTSAHALSARTSVLPRESSELLTTYLGSQATDQFIFLSLEWLEPTNVVALGEDSKVESRINEDQFLEVDTHPSWLETSKKMKAMRSGKDVSLDQCFEAFTKPERLDEHNKWYCSNCKEHVRAMKTMELWRLPNILIVHLKRFEFKLTIRREKLDTLVDFPIEGLNMSVHCVSRSNGLFVDDSVPAIYDLFAVTNHYGRLGFGHYTAFARKWDESSISREWALFDDSNVRSVGDGMGHGGVDRLVSPAAYILFYRRRRFH